MPAAKAEPHVHIYDLAGQECPSELIILQTLWPLVVGREDLRRLAPNQIMVDHCEGVPVRARYYMVMDAEFPLHMGRLGPEEADVGGD